MGTQPNDPMHGYNQGYQSRGSRSNQGWGLALAGLILGIIALGLFWIPVINYLALALGLAGLGLSIAALVIAVRNGSSARILSIAGIIVSGLAFVLCIIAISLWGALFNRIGDEDNSTIYEPAPTVTITSPAATGSPEGTGTAPSSSGPSGTAGTTTAPTAPASGETASR